MNQAELIRDLKRLEGMATDPDLLFHIVQVRELAESGYYHLQAGVIRNPVTGSEYPVMRRAGVRRHE